MILSNVSKACRNMAHYDSGGGDLGHGVSDEIVLKARNEDVGGVRRMGPLHVSRGPVVRDISCHRM